MALLGLLHIVWMRAVKNNFAELAVYAAVAALRLGWRLLRRQSGRAATAPAAAGA